LSPSTSWRYLSPITGPRALDSVATQGSRYQRISMAISRIKLVPATVER
jgi:hypothetical protein